MTDTLNTDESRLASVANVKCPASKSITDAVPDTAKKPKTVKTVKTALSEASLGQKVATVAQKIKALDWHHANGKNQSKTAKFFNVKWPELDVKQPKVSD